MQNDLDFVVRLAKLMQEERMQLAARGPQFCIHHSLWQAGTICTPGELIAGIYLVHRGKRVPLPLSLRGTLLFDFLARYRHVPQSATQISLGLRSDTFSRCHGAYAKAGRAFQRSITRTAVKQQIMRLRTALQAGMNAAGLQFDAHRIIFSERTTSNEIRYRLKGTVNWEHTSNAIFDQFGHVGCELE
jgi:hypothetical protein